MFRSKYLLIFLITFLSIFSIPFSNEQVQISHNNFIMQNMAYGSFAPPIEPIKPSVISKKNHKKDIKQKTKRPSNEGSQIALFLVSALYLLAIGYFGLSGLGLIVLGILGLIAGTGIFSIWTAVLFILYGLSLLTILIELIPIAKKLNQLKHINWEQQAPPIKLFNNTLWLAFAYLPLLLLIMFFPIVLIMINSFWIVLLIVILASTFQRRMKRKLKNNLDKLLEYSDMPQKDNNRNINNQGYNQDLLDEGYR